MKRAVLSLPILAAVLLAQPKKEEPVGLVLLPGGAKLVRAGVETPLAAKSGDVLFAGDAMKNAPAEIVPFPTRMGEPGGRGSLVAGHLFASLSPPWWGPGAFFNVFQRSFRIMEPITIFHFAPLRSVMICF